MYHWSDANKRIIERIKALFSSTVRWLDGVHVLDLSNEGYILCSDLIDDNFLSNIGPHVDSIKFSGGIVTGLSLLSSSVMRLNFENPETATALQTVPQEDKQHVTIDLFLLPRSLYIMQHAARYECKHQIFLVEQNHQEHFIPEHFKIPNPFKSRRISVICRDEKS